MGPGLSTQAAVSGCGPHLAMQTVLPCTAPQWRLVGRIHAAGMLWMEAMHFTEAAVYF